MLLLPQRGYDKLSIREIISMAGVGVGSFYEYFPSKEALAAVCVRHQIKDIARAMQTAIDASRTEVLPSRVDALIDAQIRSPLAEPERWAILFMVERQVSGIEAFRSLYGEFVGLWQTALCAGADWPEDAPLADAAFAAHAITYSFVAQRLLTQPRSADAATLRRLVRQAVHGYLSMVVPRPYRFHRLDT